ncbi:hypothetical protein ALMA_0857 [Alloscardovia macacae]|uniref:Uncharacterized protein n=1 Tax=Alloscardovia macacae TaxID=1160091 RepID=A0A261F670_9BIFI|nr:hypothetical protein ALMA_0857 [Alloscardovia macacae]
MFSAVSLYTITLVLIITCAFSMWRDNRSLLNPLLFMV